MGGLGQRAGSGDERNEGTEANREREGRGDAYCMERRREIYCITGQGHSQQQPASSLNDKGKAPLPAALYEVWVWGQMVGRGLT